MAAIHNAGRGAGSAQIQGRTSGCSGELSSPLLWLGFLRDPRKLHPLRPHGRVEELPSKPGRPFLLVVNLRRRSIVLEPVGPPLEDTCRERAYMCRHVFLQPFSGACPSPTFRCIPASAIPRGASSAREPLAPVDSNARALHSLQFTHQLYLAESISRSSHE